MANFVFSTMTESVSYNLYDEHAVNQSHHVLSKRIMIQGGANKADRFLTTPQGVATKVSDEELELLLKHPVFLLHVKNGFLSYERNKVLKPSIEKEIKNLEKKDKSAPVTEADLKKKLKVDKIEYTDQAEISEYVNDNLTPK